MRAPRRLHDQKRRPQVPDQRPGRIPTGAGCDPLQQRGAPQVEAQPHQLGREHGAPGDVHEAEQHLGQRRVDGRDVGVVDLPVPLGSKRREGFVFGRMGVRIDAFQEDVAVPEIAVDVAGELGGEGKEGQAGGDADSPQENRGRGGTAACSDPRRRVAEERGGGQQQAGQRQRDPVQPPEGGESGDLEETEGENGDCGRARRFTRMRRRPVFGRDLRWRCEKWWAPATPRPGRARDASADSEFPLSHSGQRYPPNEPPANCRCGGRPRSGPE